MSNTLILLLLVFTGTYGYSTMRGSPEYWRKIGDEELKKARQPPTENKRAKNMILFIGDGMSIPTVTGARLWRAQKRMENDPGRKLLAFEDTPHVALSKTYTDDEMVPDSAATATAMFSGVKTNSWTVGVSSDVKAANCLSYSPEHDLINIFTYAHQVGMSTGVVTTTELTHATPSASYAHSASRFWTSDVDMPKDMTEDLKKRCPDIASQFPINGINLNVVLAGGSGKFLPESEGGERKDGKNIVNKWKEEQTKRKRSFKYVDNKQDLFKVGANKSVDFLLGMFTKGHFPYADEMSDPKYADTPKLAEMVSVAVKLLSRNPKGFLLMVEGGRIDHGHHAGTARRALEEVLEFDASYLAAQKLTKPSETLMMTTADHAHTFSIGGYPKRSNNIFTFPLRDPGEWDSGTAKDGMKFTILGYANGPGAPIKKARSDPSKNDTKLPTYKQQSIVPLKKETHGGDDVGIYARGPMSHLVDGVREENYIANVLMYAGCLGPYREKQDCPPSGTKSVTAASAWIYFISTVLVLQVAISHLT